MFLLRVFEATDGRPAHYHYSIITTLCGGKVSGRVVGIWIGFICGFYLPLPLPMSFFLGAGDSRRDGRHRDDGQPRLGASLQVLENFFSCGLRPLADYIYVIVAWGSNPHENNFPVLFKFWKYFLTPGEICIPYCCLGSKSFSRTWFMNVPGVFKGMFPGRVFLLRGLGVSLECHFGGPEWTGGSHGTYCVGEPEGSRAARGGPACSQGRPRVVMRGMCLECG